MAPDQTSYRMFYLFVQNGDQECKQSVAVFIKSGKPTDLNVSFKILKRTDVWPTDGACIRVDIARGPVTLCDTYKDYSLVVDADIDNGLFVTLDIRVRPASMVRGAIPVSVKSYNQQGTEKSVTMSTSVYIATADSASVPAGLVATPARTKFKAPKGMKGVPAKERTRSPSPVPSEASVRSGVTNPIIFDVGLSRFNRRVKELPGVRDFHPDNVLIARLQSHVDGIDGSSTHEEILVDMKKPINLVSYDLDSENNYVLNDRKDANQLRLETFVVGEQLVVVVRILG